MNTKENTLDLHGVKHINVISMVEEFICHPRARYIITGGSNIMKNLVINTLIKHDVSYFIMSHNLGQIILNN